MREMHSIHDLKKDDGIIVMVLYNKKEKKDKYDRIQDKKVIITLTNHFSQTILVANG